MINGDEIRRSFSFAARAAHRVKIIDGGKSKRNQRGGSSEKSMPKAKTAKISGSEKYRQSAWRIAIMKISWQRRQRRRHGVAAGVSKWRWC